MVWACRSSRAWGCALTSSLHAGVALCVGLGVLGCGADATPPGPEPEPPASAPDGPMSATLVHALAPTALASREETIDCYSWTLDNDEALYVNAVEFFNLGSYHHSNWFTVPDSTYEGPDGAWDCADRGFEALAAAQSGTVLFAQSTQAWNERMALQEGAVIRIPPHSRIVAERHLLNLAPSERQTEAWLTLDVIHPADVATVLSPVQVAYLDLQIPAMTEIRFRAACGFDSFKVHYALPHFHATGNYFALRFGDFTSSTETVGVIWEGFGAQPLGRTFDPPLAANFLRFTCGFDNGFSQELTWGIGIDEMCVALLLVESEFVLNGVVTESLGLVDVVDGVAVIEGRCDTLGSPKGLAYEPPRQAELSTALYLPPGHETDAGPPPVPACTDANPDAAPAVAPTLDNVATHVIEPWCGFSSCHGASAAAGLALSGDDLHAALLDHAVTGPTELPLVDPGNPDGSWLYQTIARCDPGDGARAMPLNAPVLLDDETVALVREWIAAGALP